MYGLGINWYELRRIQSTTLASQREIECVFYWVVAGTLKRTDCMMHYEQGQAK